jgi:hypothetical protein
VGKFALLIGVSDSSEEDLHELPSAIKDIEAMQAVMEDPTLGCFDNVQVLRNPMRQEMEEAIETLFANRKSEDLVLFYFSGHGITDEKGKLYLVTPKTRKERGKLVKATGVAATVLHENMGNTGSKRQVLILDSCFSGAIAEGLTGKSAGSKVDIQRELGGEGRAILTSSSAVQESFHMQGYDLSIYTHYLIDGIKTGAADQNGNGYISVDELHEYVKNKLEQEDFSMSPQFFPVKGGYKIKLVRSPSVDHIPQTEVVSGYSHLRDFKDLNANQHEILGLSFSSSSPNLLHATSDSTFCSWSLEDDSFVRYNVFSKASYAEYSPDSERIAVCFSDQVQLISILDSQNFQFLPHPGVKTVCFSQKQSIFASAGGIQEGTGTICLWDFNTRMIRATLFHRAPVTTLTFTSDSEILAAGSSDKVIRCWNVKSKERLREFYLSSVPRSSAFASDNRLLFIGCDDGNVVCLDIVTAKAYSTKKHSSIVNSIVIHEESQLIFSASDDKKVNVWRLPDLSHVEVLNYKFAVKALAISEKQNMIASGLSNGDIQLWRGG